MDDYSQDYLLDKQIKILQPVEGYRASTDAVLLAAAVSAVRAGEKILDVGSGTGAVSLCLAEHFRSLSPHITGLELQPELAELSNQSAAINGFDFLNYQNCNIFSSQLANCSFHHVITNPPYAENDLPSPKTGKSTAHNFCEKGLREWIDVCIKMMHPNGWFYMVNRAAALEDILAALHGRLGSIEVMPLFSKPGQSAKRVIVRARKDRNAPLVLHSGLVLHEADGRYTPAAEEILRGGGGLF